MRSLSSASGGLYISAPGKIILFGEHAVVYGRTAIAGCIDLRTYLSLFTSADGRIYLSLPDMDVEKTWLLKDLQKACEKLYSEPLIDESPPSLDIIVPIARKLSGICEEQAGVQNLAILAFWYLLVGVMQRKRDLLAVKITVKFKLPPCVGLGSSGAYCVCLATALLQTAGIIPPPSIPTTENTTITWDERYLEIIRKWSAAAESLIHGRASGLDAAVCTYGSRNYGYQSFKHLVHTSVFGGVASYKPGRRIDNLQNIPNLKVILVNSKIERNTSRLVQHVKDKLDKFPFVIENIFNAIDQISVAAVEILQKPLIERTSDNVTENGNHILLNYSNTNTNPLFNESSDNFQNSSTISKGGRSSSLSSYAAGGKRGSSISGVSDFRTKLERNEYTEIVEKLNELSKINNQLLIALGVGHAKVDHICTLLGRYGIYPKMTGAGGGGSLFAFLKPDTSQTVVNMIKADLKNDGYDMWQPTLGGPGVLCHTDKPDLFASTETTNNLVNSTKSTKKSGSLSFRSNTPGRFNQSPFSNPLNKK